MTIKGYDLKTTNKAVVYHFVSQTSRFSEEFKHNRIQIEMNSNRNFVRKWGIPISMFNEIRYWEDSVFDFKTFSMGLTTRNRNRLFEIEPFFDKIEIDEFPTEYVEKEQGSTRYNLTKKFEDVNDVDIKVFVTDNFNQDDFNMVNALRVSLDDYGPGVYENGNITVLIIDKDQKA